MILKRVKTLRSPGINVTPTDIRVTLKKLPVEVLPKDISLEARADMVGIEIRPKGLNIEQINHTDIGVMTVREDESKYVCQYNGKKFTFYKNPLVRNYRK